MNESRLEFMNRSGLMATKEVAKALGVSERVIQKHAKELGLTRNGVKTLFTEYQATEIKNKIANSGRNDLANVCEVKNITTETEENEIVMRAFAILKRKNDEYKQRTEIAESKCIELQPKADYADKALKTTSQMSITDAGKTLKIRQSEMFEFLRNMNLITSKNVPTQNAIDKNVLTLKSYVVGDVVRKSACMTMENIKNFKERYIDTGKFCEYFSN